MSQVAMTVNGRIYRLSCEDGDEKRLLQLGADVAAHVDEFTQTFGQVGENRLLLLAALRLADELMDAQTLLETHTGASVEALKDLKKARASQSKKTPLKAQVTDRDSETAPPDLPPSDPKNNVAS